MQSSHLLWDYAALFSKDTASCFIYMYAFKHPHRHAFPHSPSLLSLFLTSCLLFTVKIASETFTACTYYRQGGAPCIWGNAHWTVHLCICMRTSSSAPQPLVPLISSPGLLLLPPPTGNLLYTLTVVGVCLCASAVNGWNTK